MADRVAANTAGGHTLVVLSRLRNSIHGAAIDALAMLASSGRPEGTLVGLSHAETDELLLAIDSLDGREAWGVRETLPHRAHADLGVLLDRLFVGAVDLIES